MMKRIILFALCLVMAVSACLAEGTPAASNRYKASMLNEIPEKTMKELFTEYMVPGYKVDYDTGRAWCPDLIMSGEGCYETYYEITDNERVRICREIAEKLFRTVYPDTEPELVCAMSWRDHKLCWVRERYHMELKDGQWYYLDKPLTHEVEGALGAARLVFCEQGEKAAQTDPSWIILQYHPAAVGGLPVSMYIWPSERYCNNYSCLTTFIFDGDNHIISAYMGGSFTAKPAKEADITVSKEDALRIAREYFAEEKTKRPTAYQFDWRGMVWGDTFDYLLKALGYSSIRQDTVLDESSERLVMFMTKKWELIPAWEFHLSKQVIADGQVIKDDFRGDLDYIYISAEDGTPGLEYGITGDYD